MDISTRYFSSGGPVYDKLMTRETMAKLQAALEFHADVADLHDALTTAYNNVYAQGGYRQHGDQAIDGTVRMAADILRSQHAAALAIANARYALDQSTQSSPAMAPRPLVQIQGKARAHKRQQPPPRSADSYGRDNRAVTAPKSNRALSAAELKQMRGVATQELSNAILNNTL